MTIVETTKIIADAGTQTRTGLDEATLDRYTEAVKAGKRLPPIVVFKHGEKHFIADGFHRYNVLLALGDTDIDCDVREGTARDALAFALSANDDHGLPRSPADKRKAVRTALRDDEWLTWSDRRIANLCAVSHTLVSQIRRDMQKSGQIEEAPIRASADGRERPATVHVDSRSDESATGNVASRKDEKPKKQPLTDEQKRAAKQVRDDAKRQKLDRANRETVILGLDSIAAVPFDGKTARAKYRDQIDADRVRYVRDWCNEFLADG